jgi:hypothetical protein
VFGYIKIDKPELKVKEYEVYKAVYCSLCKELGKYYGILARLTLSYDFTFLALLNMSLKDGCPHFVKKRCAFNPLKKCSFCRDGAFLDMPCAVAMIMLYYKICDNIADEKGFRKLGYILLKPLFSKAHKKAAQKYPQVEGYVKDYIQSQLTLEKENCRDLDRVADCTASALAKIFTLCSESAEQKRVLSRLGYCIGRYIYLLDAACDFEKDAKSGSYNVFRYENTDLKSVIERVKPQLYFCINEAAKAFELLDIKKYKPILGNIIYLGLEETLKKELAI